MANSFDTSFIPQQPLLKVEGSSRQAEPLNLALVFAFIIFFATLIVLGGVYFYKTSVETRVLANETILKEKEASLRVEEIDRYKAFSDRLTVAKKLLQDHVAFSTVLALLEKVTAQDVGWTALSYGEDATLGKFRVTLTGQAPSYSAVYAQAQAWKNMHDTLEQVEVSMPTLDISTGVVTFNAVLTIDPSYLRYARALKEGGATTGTSSAETSAGAAPLSPEDAAKSNSTNTL